MLRPLRFFRSLARPVSNRLRLNNRFSAACKEYGARGIQPPVLYDIGARWGVSEPYDRLKQIPGFRSVGFEPDTEEALHLERAGCFDVVCPVGLGDKTEKRTLYIAKDPGSSTLFPPDMREIARHTISRQFETVSETTIDVLPLDDVVKEKNLPLPDFIKVDCEGAEEIIFAGAEGTLKNVIGVTFEARLVEFYQGGATLGPLLNRFLDAGFILLRQNSVGAFFDAQMMFDVVMIKHPESYRTPRHELLGRTFSLLHGSLPYAQRIRDVARL